MSLTEWSLPTFAEFLNKGKEVVDSVKQTSSEFYQAGVAAYNDGASAVEGKIEEAKYSLWELLTAQAEVDARLSQMDAGPEKEKLTRQKEESRSFFTDKIAPLAAQLFQDQENYDRISIGDSLAYENFAGMRASEKRKLDNLGLLPAVPVALGAGAVAVSTAIIYWCHEAYALERAILDDPSLSVGEKYKLALKASESGILGGLSKLKLPLILGMALVAVYLAAPSRGSSK